MIQLQFAGCCSLVKILLNCQRRQTVFLSTDKLLSPFETFPDRHDWPWRGNVYQRLKTTQDDGHPLFAESGTKIINFPVDSFIL